MIKHNQDGAVNGLAISLVMTVVLLLATVGFAAWAFSSRQDYKDNVDSKINDAVTIAKQQESTSKDKQFAEAEKQPLRTYTGPEAFGSLIIKYPKTWSGYVDDTGTSGSAQLDGYFYPAIVPSIANQDGAFALRIQVVDQPYAQVLKTFSGNSLPTGQTRTITAYALPKVPSVVGVLIAGTLSNSKTGTMVILPLRDKTLQIRTDGNQFLNDFNANILPNLSFSP